MHFSLENTGRLKYKYVEKFVASKMTFISGIMKQSIKIFMLYPMVLKSSLFQVVQKYKLIYKVGPIFPMVIWSEFRLGKYRDDDHREDAPHFNIGCIIHRLCNIAYIKTQLMVRFLTQNKFLNLKSAILSK